jgi:predicted Zn-dependent peptidase
VQIEQSRLESGLTVITARLAGFDSAAVAASVNAGARYETEANNGIAHFLEHMAFKGTRDRSSAQIAREIEQLGSSINAFTSPAMTTYFVSGLGRNIGRSVDILGDVLTRSVLAASDIDVERGVILQEIKRAEDDPQSVASRGFARTAYPNQPAGRPVLGRAEFIRAATRQDFADFLAEHYHAGNMVVIGAGDFSHARFRELVAEHFAALPVRSERTHAVQARWGGGLFTDSSRPFEQAQVILGLPSLPCSDPGHYAHQLMAMALGQGMSSPLFQEVREKRGLVYTTVAFSDHEPDHGDFGIYGGMTPDNLPTFIDVVCELMLQADRYITADDLERARNTLLVRRALEKERPFQLAMHVVSHLFDTGSLLDPDEERQRIEAVTLADIHAAASHVADNVPTLALVGPVADVAETQFERVTRAFHPRARQDTRIAAE